MVDDFTATCLRPEVVLRSLDARVWRAQIALFRPDVLFVESAWRGHRDSWRRRIASYEGVHDDTLGRLVAHCRSRDVPTVFWNKEDPVHYERFLAAARMFDFVFTTDAELLPTYERDCGGRPVTVRHMQFAAQPVLHHPVGARRSKRVCFAGSYGEEALAQRREDLEVLLDAASELGLDILDRNARARSSAKAFPPRFAPYLRDRVAYRALGDVYRSYEVFLNVNSVREGTTAFARRVFEILACGTAVVSSPSAELSRLFGDVVATASSHEEARKALRRFLEDDEHRIAATCRGIRRVLLGDTYEDRLVDVCRAMGISAPEGKGPRVTALTLVHSAEEAARWAGALRSQEWPPSSVVVGLRDMDDGTSRGAEQRLRHDVDSAPMLVVDTRHLPDERAASRHLAARLPTPHVACVAVQHHCGPEVLGSLAACVRFAPADMVGKASGAVHEPVDRVHPHCVLMSKGSLSEHGWSSRPEDLAALDAAHRSLRKYATDGDGFRPREP